MSVIAPLASGPLARRISHRVVVAYRTHEVVVGWHAPVVVQSMTNTDTADVIGIFDVDEPQSNVTSGAWIQ